MDITLADASDASTATALVSRVSSAIRIPEGGGPVWAVARSSDYENSRNAADCNTSQDGG